MARVLRVLRDRQTDRQTDKGDTMNRFDKFTDQEQGLIHCALFIAIEQWRKDKVAVPDMAIEFDRQIVQAESFQAEIGY